MKRKPKSAKEVEKEVAKLREMKPTVLRTSSFGDNHHDAIDAQIEVLKESLDNDDIYDRWGSSEDEDEDRPHNILDAALDAMGWMDGGSFGEGKKPSKNWAELVR